MAVTETAKLLNC
ncbi:unnamed protein product [Ophioblennius macclurei]